MLRRWEHRSSTASVVPMLHAAQLLLKIAAHLLVLLACDVTADIALLHQRPLIGASAIRRFHLLRDISPNVHTIP